MKARFSLEAGRSIASASEEDHCNPKLTFPPLMIEHPLKAKCSKKPSAKKEYLTFWNSVDTTSAHGTKNSFSSGSFQLRPLVIGSRYSPIQPVCLTNFDNAANSNHSADSFFLTVDYCKPGGNSMDRQQFSITVEQVSVEKSQVFFAIRNHKNSGKWCAGRLKLHSILSFRLVLANNLIFCFYFQTRCARCCSSGQSLPHGAVQRPGKSAF